jgi:MoaA/NifB/PqqE/SkfB family radical SAM enzyme
VFLLKSPHVQDKELATPDQFADICRAIKPVVAQVSGGEPLLRKDVLEIIRKLKNGNGTPFMVLTTNGALLNKNRYYELIEAGIDEIAISLDYPDDRHDKFRAIPGLFNRIETLLRDLGSSNRKGIIVSCVIQRENYKDIIGIAEFGRKYGIAANFSTYTWMRTNDKTYIIPKDEIPQLKKLINELIHYKKKYKNVRASDYVLRKIPEFFENNEIPNCRSGERCLVINPDGTFSPCGLILCDYNTLSELRNEFSKNNTCTKCYTSSRANTEKPVWYHIRDNLRFI